ncbi:MAG: eukaryotic-like serine/threonine-protein kinase [Thermoleophilaceae bacterium]|jgi:serine/threonine-protein kinase|nr:eukaryotic-like serine/threonine-protein kinase [Thermoleophilaceae bacterium]
MVDGRYRITGRIGTGGMADVYCAHDEHLGRDVALKMLHRRFAQDQEFVERFRREASAAAGLQHPNVVGVFDRGQFDGTYYIAMEFLRGRTLKDLIVQEAPLDQMRALDITVQILRAAGFGHRRGVIHRDFKPQNVIVDDEDRVKVTDFGIARAGASEITETGSIMGTAQYLSPEQAQGTAAEEPSDLYSIGVMMFEMLSGQLPFDGDSAVAVALRHLTEPPPPLHQLRPDVHPALEAVVNQALAKDPRQRFQDAEGFIAALEHVRPQLQAMQPGQDTADWTAIAAPVAYPPQPYETMVAPAPPYGPPDARGQRRMWPWILLVLLLAAIVAGAVLFAGQRNQVAVPGVIGSPAANARTLLEQRGFQVNVDRKPSLQPPDQVIQQDPAPGQKAKKGSTVNLTVSSGPPPAVVPDVTDLPLKVALARLRKKGFVPDINQSSSDTVNKGLVISTTPAGGTLLAQGEHVTVDVSSGVAKFAVPNVIGLDQGAAEQLLQAKGLVPVVVQQESDQATGNVFLQDPVAGTKVASGDRVTITVSKGPATVAVPDVVGLTRSDAQGALTAAGLNVQVKTRKATDPADDGIVLDQRPGHDTQLKKGRTVVLYVGKYTAPPTGTTTTPDTGTTTTPAPSGTVTPGTTPGAGT